MSENHPARIPSTSMNRSSRPEEPALHPAILVTEASFLNAGVPGGVQLCTAEYLALLEACGLDVEPFTVHSTRRISTRLKKRLGLEAYELYDTAAIAPRLIEHVRDAKASVVALNQVNLVGLALPLREAFGSDVRLIASSTGK